MDRRPSRLVALEPEARKKNKKRARLVGRARILGETSEAEASSPLSVFRVANAGSLALKLS
jgi:hypothetical protein